MSSASTPDLLDGGDAERVDHLAHQRQLLAQDVGRGDAVGLVLGVPVVAERLLGPVERHGDGVGLVVPDQVDEHRREAEHGVGDLPRRRDQVGGQGVERPVGEGVAVDEHEPHGSRSYGLGLTAATGGPASRRVRLSDPLGMMGVRTGSGPVTDQPR